MAASYTTVLRLVKQAQRDASWHTLLNTTIDLVDEALSYQSIAITGDTTLTLTDGVASPVRGAVLEFTGTIAANATITLPAKARAYKIKNSTTGGFSLVFTNGSGATATIANGDSAVIFNTASNIYLLGGTAGQRNTGTSGANVPLLNGTNTWSGKQTMSGKSFEFAKGADVASASSCDIWTPADGNFVNITGTTDIDDFGTAPQAGVSRIVLFTGALNLVDGANLRVNKGGSNYKTADGDIAIVTAQTTTTFKVAIFPRSGLAPKAPSVALFQNVQTSGTGGGDVGTSFADFTLNTEVYDPDGIASLSSNVVTITNSGVYLIEWCAHLCLCDRAQSRLYDNTAGASLISGNSGDASAINNSSIFSYGSTVVTLTASNEYKMQGRGQSANSGDGQGMAASMGESERYGWMKITKLA